MYGGGSTGLIGLVDPDPREQEADYDEMPVFADYWEDEEEMMDEEST